MTAVSTPSEPLVAVRHVREVGQICLRLALLAVLALQGISCADRSVPPSADRAGVSGHEIARLRAPVIIQLESRGAHAVAAATETIVRDGGHFRFVAGSGGRTDGRIGHLRSLFLDRGSLETADAARELLARARRKRSWRGPMATAASQPLAERLANVYLLEPTDDVDPEALAEELAADPRVAYAQPNYPVESDYLPNDPFFSSSSSWGQEYPDLWGLHSIEAEAAWDVARGENVVVAVIDSGLDMMHPDIADNVWSNLGEIPDNGIDDDSNGRVDDTRGWDFFNDDNDPTDDGGHGTHVSGTIAASIDNGAGIVGVAPAATVMPLKATNAAGNGSTDRMAAAIVYAAANGARVINNSWSCSRPCPSNPVVEDAVRYAHGLGAVVVMSAGNASRDAKHFSPQNMAETVTVASTDHLDAPSDFSNNGGSIDLAAPGGDSADSSGNHLNILSLRAAGTDLAHDPSLIVADEYYRARGTSMSAPHVSGAAALVLSQHPGWSNEQVRRALLLGCDDIGAPGFDPQSGHGRLDARAALEVPAPLAVLLTAPIEGNYSVNQLDVRGIVQGPGLQQWLLQHGSAFPGGDPSTWTTLAQASTPVNGDLITSWDVSGVDDGHWQLRLLATDTGGQQYEDRAFLHLDRVHFSPTLVPIVGAGVLLEIAGTAAPARFGNFEIRVLDLAFTPVPGAVVVLTNDGGWPVVDGLLATWDTTGTPPGSYLLNLEVFRDGTFSINEYASILVTDTQPGWPVSIEATLGVAHTNLALTNHLTAGDVDDNGSADLLIAYNDAATVISADGQSLPGWPQSLDPWQVGAHTNNGPLLGDLTSNGVPNVAASASRFVVHLWEPDGNPVDGWPRGLGPPGALYIEDLDADGRSELIARDLFGAVRVFDQTGRLRAGWPVDLPHILGGQAMLAIGDVDWDGHREIVAATAGSERRLYVLRLDGRVLPGWPTQELQSVDSLMSPVLGDMDGDSDLEILVNGGDGWVHGFHHDGTKMAGWPCFARDSRVNDLALGDIDGDLIPEVVAGVQHYADGSNRAEALYAWHADGTPLAGWPIVLRNVRPEHSFFGFGAPVLADVDDDRIADVVVSSDASELGTVGPLHAYRYDATELPGFPKVTLGRYGSCAPATAAVADLDGDGLLELAWIGLKTDHQGSEHFLYLWDLAGSASTLAPWPMFRANPGHTAVAQPVPALPPVVCGDGRVRGTEECDDSNTADGDGCSADCRLEHPTDGGPADGGSGSGDGGPADGGSGSGDGGPADGGCGSGDGGPADGGCGSGDGGPKPGDGGPNPGDRGPNPGDGDAGAGDTGFGGPDAVVGSCGCSHGDSSPILLALLLAVVWRRRWPRSRPAATPLPAAGQVRRLPFS